MSQTGQTTVSVRIDKAMHEQMKQHDEVNWSGVLRRSIAQAIEQSKDIEKSRMAGAMASMDRIRESGVFRGGKGRSGDNQRMERKEKV
ncbi:hypothetical protein HYU14_06225 [Candidatus Woesearchaeota archaeon]|nr:hypothetical protein [Candidatus Woesearchaeota archaeon]